VFVFVDIVARLGGRGPYDFPCGRPSFFDNNNNTRPAARLSIREGRGYG
jgi:hypothetical protein